MFCRAGCCESASLCQWSRGGMENAWINHSSAPFCLPCSVFSMCSPSPRGTSRACLGLLCWPCACLFLELLHGTTSPNHDTSWLHSQPIKVRLTGAGLQPCLGGCCSKGSACALGSSQQSMAPCREVAAAPEPLAAPKA